MLESQKVAISSISSRPPFFDPSGLDYYEIRLVLDMPTARPTTKDSVQNLNKFFRARSETLVKKGHELFKGCAGLAAVNVAIFVMHNDGAVAYLSRSEYDWPFQVNVRVHDRLPATLY